MPFTLIFLIVPTRLWLYFSVCWSFDPASHGSFQPFQAVLLKKREYRVSISEQVVMADKGSLSCRDKCRKSSSFILSSPRLFTGFTSKGYTDTESMMSPTSILDSKPVPSIKTQFWSDGNTNSPRTSKPASRIQWDDLDSKGVGLGLVDALIDDLSEANISKTESRMVLFGSKLKIQIPPLPPSPNSDYPMSPGDFGTKTRNSQLGFLPRVLSPYSSKKSPFGSMSSGLEKSNPPRIFSADEMELSEDYTRVITHGPNPKTTHIFDDCIIESCCGVVGLSASVKKEHGFGADQTMRYPSESFLSFCYSCKKKLGQGKDIYMYRGEKAFCSNECRYKEIISDEGNEKSDDTYGT